MTYAEIAATLVKSIGLMALAAAIYGGVQRSALSAPVRNLLIGLVFASLMIVTMTTPARIAEGLTIDGRTIIVGMGAALGGPIAAIVVAGIGIFYRMIVFAGPGEIYSASAMVIAGILGSCWWVVWREEKALPVWQLALGGLVISLSLLTVLAAPRPIALAFLFHVVPTLAAVNVCAAIALGLLIERERELTRAHNRLARDAGTDSLTGLANRRMFEQRFEALAANDAAAAAAIALIDVDRFKQINDTHGHGVGDEVLASLAARMRESFRETDTVARLGGEEFAILLPDIEPAEALTVTERALQSIRRKPFEVGDVALAVTVSAGLNSFAPEPGGLRRFLKQADGALYEAKASGRDRLVSVGAGAIRRVA